MEENLIEKCRTCLKGDLKMNPLTMLVKGYSDKPTYCKLLQESVRLESPDEYEHLMPQNICTICCKELRKAYTFIRQAQFSNKTLMSFIEKQLSNTTETPIVMPECKVNDKEDASISQHSTKTYNLEVDSTNVLLQPIKMESATEQDEKSAVNHFSYETDEEFCENDEYNVKRAVSNQSVTYFEVTTVAENKLVEDIEQQENEDGMKNSVKIKTETNLDNYCAIDQTTQIIEKEANEFLTEESEGSEGHQFECTDTKNDSLDLPYHVSVNEVPKIVNEENSSFLETNTNWSKESSMNQFEESDNNTDSENSEMADSYQTSIISEIKIEETHIEMQNNEFDMEENGKDNAFECPSCDHVAKNRHALFYHKRTRHGTEEDKVKCHFCSFTHSLKQGVLKHIKKKHKQLIKTLKAENKTLSTTNKDASTSTLLKEIPFQKEENLEDEFLSDDNMALQKKKAKNSISSSKIRMEKTEEQSSDEEFIKKLLNIKKVKPPKKQSSELSDRNQCDKCGKICNSSEALYSHTQTHRTEEEKLPCPQCERKFKRRFELKNHSYSHAGITYNCDICSKGFATNQYLITHKRRHAMEEQECEDCGKVVKYMQRHKQKCLANNEYNKIIVLE